MSPREVFAVIAATGLTIAAGAGSAFYGKWVTNEVHWFAGFLVYAVALLGVGGAWYVFYRLISGDRS